MRKSLFMFVITFSVNAMGQNLVLNPSFEDTIPCIVYQNIGPPQLPCSSWYWANSGSSDYFSEQYLCISSPAPSNVFGFQYARTGVAYCGFGLYHNTVTSFGYREYLGGQLSDTLKQGHTYCVSFYAVKSDSGKFYTSNIGMYLSPDSSVDYSTALNLPYIPQIINTNGIIYDTLNWTQISGNYIAGGGEKYFIIGNFNTDANTTLDSNNQSQYLDRYSYYYIDDVSVVDCTVGINEIESYKNKISLLPNPATNETIYLNQLLKSESGVVTVYTKMGVAVESFLIHEGNNRIAIDLQKLSQGVYIVETKINNRIKDVRKLVVIK